MLWQDDLHRLRKNASTYTKRKEPASQMQLSMGSSLRTICLLHAAASLRDHANPSLECGRAPIE